MIQFDEHIFQMGWFNHQLDDFEGLGWNSEALNKFDISFGEVVGGG